MEDVSEASDDDGAVNVELRDGSIPAQIQI